MMSKIVVKEIVRVKRPMYAVSVVYVALLMIATNIHAGWIRTYGKGACYSVQQTSDGGYIAVGEIANGFGDVILVKTDSTGLTEWSKTYGDTAELVSDIGKCVQQTADNGYIVVGHTGAFGGSDVLWLLKTNETGDTAWTRKYGEPYWNQGNFVQQTNDGGFIVTGFYDIGGLERSNLLLFKTDSTGNIAWLKVYGTQESDGGYCVRQTNDDGYIVVGFKGKDQGYKSTWLLKTDSSGDTLWSRTYGGYPTSKGTCVQQTRDGGYIVIGNQDAAPGIGYIWLIKTDENGYMEWQRIYNNVGESFGYQFSVQQILNGSFLIAGTVRFLAPPRLEQIVLMKTDSVGNLNWYFYYGDVGSDDWGYGAQRVSDGGYIIAGETVLGEDPNNNFTLIKTNSRGQLAVKEEPVIPQPSGWFIDNPVGSEIVIRFTGDLSASSTPCVVVYDALGRKVDEVHSSHPSGTLTWGEGFSPGVYFIKTTTRNSPVAKVILLR